jgi:hypothetical protein
MKYIPHSKTVPGTYSEDNYGRYIEDLKAYDAKGTLLTVKKLMLILGPFQQRPLKNLLI